jgi:hypothetical protein
MEAISHLPRPPKLIQIKCDFDRFVLTEEIISPWEGAGEEMSK